MAPSSTLSAVWNVVMIGAVFLACSLLYQPLSSALTETVLLVAYPRVILDKLAVPINDEIEKETCGTEIQRLKTVMKDLEAKYGYDAVKKGIRVGGQVNLEHAYCFLMIDA